MATTNPFSSLRRALFNKRTPRLPNFTCPWCGRVITNSMARVDDACLWCNLGFSQQPLPPNASTPVPGLQLLFGDGVNSANAAARRGNPVQ